MVRGRGEEGDYDDGSRMTMKVMMMMMMGAINQESFSLVPHHGVRQPSLGYEAREPEKKTEASINIEKKNSYVHVRKSCLNLLLKPDAAGRWDHATPPIDISGLLYGVPKYDLS